MGALGQGDHNIFFGGEGTVWVAMAKFVMKALPCALVGIHWTEEQQFLYYNALNYYIGSTTYY